MKLASLVMIVTATLTARTAHAQPESNTFEPKSSGVALGLSLGMTAAGIGMSAAGLAMKDGPFATSLTTAGFAGVMLGPSAGHFYAREYGTPGLYIRWASLAVAGAGLLMMVVGTTESVVGHGDDDKVGLGNALAIGGLVGVGVGATWDIVTAPSAAKRYNQERAALVFTPVVLPAADGPAAGAGIVGRF